MTTGGRLDTITGNEVRNSLSIALSPATTSRTALHPGKTSHCAGRPPERNGPSQGGLRPSFTGCATGGTLGNPGMWTKLFRSHSFHPRARMPGSAPRPAGQRSHYGRQALLLFSVPFEAARPAPGATSLRAQTGLTLLTTAGLLDCGGDGTFRPHNWNARHRFIALMMLSWVRLL
jgi:hypothetical protein